MAAIIRREDFDDANDDADLDPPANERVESFLDCEETRRQSSNRAGWAVLAVGALVAGVAYLTSIGLVGPDARAAAASAGTLVVGYVGYVVGHKE